MAMNARCPNCDTDLKRRYMPTSPTGPILLRLPSPIKVVIRKHVAMCPDCGTPLVREPHPLDQAAAQWLWLPIVMFLVGLWLQEPWLQVAAGGVLFAGVAWLAWRITRPDYTQRRVWKAYVPDAE